MQKVKNKQLLLIGATALMAMSMPLFLGNTSASADSCKHDYQTAQVEATCTERGYTLYACTICGDSYQDNYTQEKGHEFSDVIVDPTCTHKGYTTHFCE